MDGRPSDDEAVDDVSRDPSLYASRAGTRRTAGLLWLLGGVGVLVVGMVLVGIGARGHRVVPPVVPVALLVAGLLSTVRGLFQIVSGRSWAQLGTGARVLLLVLVLLGTPVALLLLLVALA